MKNIFLFLFFSACLSSIRSAGQQPPKEDAQAILARAQKMLDSVAKARGIKSPDLKSMTANMPSTMGTSLSKPDSLKYSIPPRNEGALAAIPQKTLSKDDLKNFITGVDKRLTDILKNAGAQLPNVESYDAGTLCQGAIMNLLQGGGDETAWLAIKAIEKAPGNILVLNNCGAVLNGCGFQPVAVPVLQIALDKSPNNSTIQNNLGQAYIALGDVQKAMLYLQQCITKSPQNPHANFSLACIYNSRGDKASALKYVENSLRGSFSDGAWHLLYKLKKDPKLMDYMKDRYQQPVYFDEDKYHLPMQCEKVADIGDKQGEYKKYHTMVESAKRQMMQIANEEMELGKKSMQENIQNSRQSNIANAPFAELGSAMLLDISNKMTEDGGPEIGKRQKEYRDSIKSLNDEYLKKRNNAHSCQEETGLANQYMEKMAFVTTEYQKAYLRIYKDYYTDNIFWGFFAYPDEHIKKGFFCKYAASLLAVLSQLAETHFLTTCEAPPEVEKDTDKVEIPRPDCPINVDLNVIVGSLHLDCEKIKFSTKREFGEIGLLLDVEHTFNKHRTTIVVGAGVDVTFEKSVGNLKGEASAAGKMQYFLTFDGTRPADMGMIWKGGVSYKEQITNDYGFKNITTTDADYTMTTTLSVVNGYGFEGGIYKQIDKVMGIPPEKQMNQNVKIYK
ncbi:MAG TPA: tetratricopeptide repeat protein [Puia sp.]|nr:tetratricopeptide repeat protein [Puia sp.]